MGRLGVGLVAAALVLAGCIGAMAQGTPAMEHRDTADEEAHASHPGAELVSVGSFETNETWDEDEPGGYASSHAWGNATIQDDTIGDGGPPLWVYTYRLDNATYEVVVDEDGEVLATERDDGVDEDAHAIEDWQVTSIEAVEIVQDNNASWTIDDEGAAAYELEQENATSDPIWSMVRFDEDVGIMWARVNATTGEFLGAGSFSFDFGWSWNASWDGWGSGWSGWGSGSSYDEDTPEQEGGHFEDMLTLLDDTREHAFTIQAQGHPVLGVQLRNDGPGTGGVEATVEGPEGEMGTLELAANSGSQQTWTSDGQPPAGDYTITVELTEGAERSYAIDWCADGPEGDDEAAEEACENIGSFPSTMGPAIR